MRELVVNLLNISVQAALIFAVLLAVRGIFALGRVPKKFACGLWAILFMRLLLPVQLESGWGLMPRESGLIRAIEEARTEKVSGQRESVMAGPAGNEGIVRSQVEDGAEGQDNVPPYSAAIRGTSRQRPPATDPEKGNSSDMPVLGGAAGEWACGWLIGIWLAGVILLWGQSAFYCLALKKRLCVSVLFPGVNDSDDIYAAPPKSGREEIYLADAVSTPFVLGLFRPRIYLPSNMEKAHYPYVIAHERVHIRRRDYLLKPGAYLLTCLYWFHPLVWAGYLLMCRDMEMACDEAVLGEANGDCRGEYADSLLRLTCGKRYSAGVPLSFGEGNTRGRIVHIMKYKKPVFLVAAAAAALTVVLAALLLTSPRQGEDGDLSLGEPTVGEEDAPGQFPGEPPGVEGSNSVDFQVSYEEIPCPAPVRTGYTSLGADGAILDYADEETVVFHGYFGLYVYSVSAREIIGAVDLQALGCGDTQGDSACQVLVSQDGNKVYFYPMSGMKTAEWQTSDPLAGHTGSRNDMEEEGQLSACYVYDTASGRLRIMTSDLWEPRQFYSREGICALTGDELSEGQQVPWEESGVAATAGRSFYTDYCMRFREEDEWSWGYLASGSGMLEDLIYVWGPWSRQIGGGMKYVQLFGGEGRGNSVASYGPESTRLTIDGAEYDLARSMTRVLEGDQVLENPEGVDLVNAVYGLYSLDGCWVVEGHIGPRRNAYSIYDPETKQWVYHIVGTSLAWSDRPEDMENAREKSRLLATGIYALDNVIFTVGGQLLTAVELAQGEHILGLERTGNEVTVIISTDDAEGNYRTMQFQFGVSQSSYVIEL